MIIFDIIEITDMKVRGSFVDLEYSGIGIARQAIVSSYGKRESFDLSSRLDFDSAKIEIEKQKPLIVRPR